MTKTVLIVDDSAATRQIASLVLKGGGYDLIESCDGVDALAKLEGQEVHLIISDINMPRMDGIDFVKKVREQPTLKFTPVVMLSVDSFEALRLEARNLGVKAWMVKPFDQKKLLDMVSRFVKQ